MTMEEIVDRWSANKTAIDVRDIGEPVMGNEWYRCPCGCGNKAYRPCVMDGGTFVGMAEIMTCFASGRQWVIVTDAAEIVCDEEQRYFDLLAKADVVCRKVFARRGTGEDVIAFLKDTHGIDEEIARSFI